MASIIPSVVRKPTVTTSWLHTGLSIVFEHSAYKSTVQNPTVTDRCTLSLS